MANPCIVEIKGKKYSYAEYLSALHDGLLDSLIKEGLVDDSGFKKAGEQPKLIGTKNAMVHPELEALGVQVPPRTPRPSDAEQIIKARKDIDEGNVNPYDIVSEINDASSIDETSIKPSYEPVLKVHLADLKRQSNAVNDRMLEVEKQLEKEPDNEEAQLLKASLNVKNIQIQDDLKQAYLASDKAGSVWSRYGNNRQAVIDQMEVVQAQIKKIRSYYNGEIPKEIEEKLSELEKENDRLEEENRAILKEYESKQSAMDDAEFEKALKDEYAKGYSAGKQATYRERARGYAKAAGNVVRKLKTKPFVLRDADGNEINITQNALIPNWNDIVEVVAKTVEATIEAGGSMADGVADGIEKAKKALSSYGWYSKLSDRDKSAVDKQIEANIRKELETDKKTKRFTVPKSRIKELIKEKGITDINQLVEELKGDYPDKTDREIRDGITGYGTVSEPSTDPTDAAMRKMNRKGRVLSALEDIENEKLPARSGQQRDTLTDEERADLRKIRDGIKKLPVSEEEEANRMKSAEKIIERTLENRIADIDRELKGEEKTVNSLKIPDTEKIKQLRAKKAEKEQQLREFRRANKEDDTLDAIEELAKKENATSITPEMVKNGLIRDLLLAKLDKGTPLKEVSQAALESLKDILPDVTKEQLQDAFRRKGIYESDKKTLDALQKQLADLKSQLNLNNKIENIKKGIVEATKKKGEQSEEVKALQKQLAEAKKEAINTYADVASADLEKQIRTVQTQIDNGNYAKPKNKKMLHESDAKWLQNKQKLSNIKTELNNLESAALNSKKSKRMLAMDVAANWSRRALFFGSIAYQKSLSVAASTILVTKVPEEILAGVYKAVLPKTSNKAPIEGFRGASESGKALGSLYKETFNPFRLFKGTKQIVSEGQSKLDAELSSFSKNNYSLKDAKQEWENNEWYHTIPNIALKLAARDHIPGIDLLATDAHMIIKDPLKRGLYEYAFSKYLDYYRSLGMDKTNPELVQMAQYSAYRFAKAEIFMGSPVDKYGNIKDKTVTERINSYINKMEREGLLEKDHAKYGKSKLYGILFPVVGVGSRIVDMGIKTSPPVFTYNLLGSLYKEHFVQDAIKNMSANECDIVIRDLKKGAIGSAAWALGFYVAYQMLNGGGDDDKKTKTGGLYNGFLNKKDRRIEGLPGASEVTFNMNGKEKQLDHNTEHSTTVLSFQMGATAYILYHHFNNPHIGYKTVETESGKKLVKEIQKDDKAKATGKSFLGTTGAMLSQYPLIEGGIGIYNATQNNKGLDAYERQIDSRVNLKKKYHKYEDGLFDFRWWHDKDEKSH